MASTFVNNLRLEEMATGENSGSWGTKTNNNLELIGQALGYGTRAIANASSDIITIADGASDADRSFYLRLSGGGQACTITLTPDTISKVWMIENATAAAVTMKQGSGSGASVAIPAGQVKMIATDGLGSGAVVYDLLTDVNLAGTTVVDDLTVSDTALVTGVLTTTAASVSNGGGQFNGAINVGVDGTGYDVKFFGDTASAFMLWDQSADDLILGGAAGLSVNSTALVTGVLTTTAATVFNGGFAANDGSTITTADNTTQLTLISTDADANVGPNLTLFRNSANPDDNDAIGRINFQAQNDRSGGSTLNYAFIESFILDASDGAESAELTFKIATAGATNNRLKFNATETVFNDTGRDFDFRVETEDGQHSLFVEGSSGNVGMFGDAGVQTIDHYANYTTLTLGNITGGIIQFEDDGTQIAQIFNTATDLVIKNTKGDGDILINGIDNASSFTALKLDMSDAGTAIFNSRVAIADGTASLPSFTFSGDTNTGMYRIGSDVLGLATAGAERVRISASGIAFHGDTATANHLNDYEEGTWTPAISATTGSLTTVNSIIGTYIKIGTKLTVFFSFNVADVGNGSGFLNVADIPFTEDNSALQFYTGIVRARSGNTVTVSSGISELDADGTLYLYGNQVRTGLFHGQVTFKTT